MRAAPRRKRGRTGAGAEDSGAGGVRENGSMPGRGTERGPNPRAVPSAPVRTPPLRSAVGCGDLGRLKDSGPPPPQRCCPHPGRAPPEPPALLPVPPGAEAGAGQRYCSSSGSFAAQLGSRRCGCERRSTALRAAAKLLPDCCGVTSLSSSLTGPPSPSQDPHSPLMRNPAAIHISGWGSSFAPMPALKRGE
ncbi:potassium/sodium hyperpolarization-activated cyclic nucleotide-gated channel 2-like isoform X2 [Gallus gallus]|uniref:potassium/sodium hyperpolarization-activated cyclic nucleotide-gated channel 2-like isoform X2 n=1 Tax=Gallus gallus TaxID=9031 RepID=UPI001F01FC91|nr:potassium/sodium hyperpolarization-activated cyclic nucleotide-gated channel 2-like isoform X2 [Gallus gallus]